MKRNRIAIPGRLLAPRLGDETDHKLDDAPSNNKLEIGLLDVVFEQSDESQDT